MHEFTNETIDISKLPKIEEISFSKLHSSYWNVILFYTVLLFIIIGIGLTIGIYNIEEWEENSSIIGIAYVVLLLITFLFTRMSFKKKAFAFRNHDVLFRYGIIATNTVVIPYNRVQHVSLHEGVVSRYFGLATVQIFTAGGSSSDIEIPGIQKEQAENIKQLLMGKIQKEL